jgi:excisionase family DNA binding protein
MGEKKELYTIREVSEMAGISESEIIRFVMLKKLKATRVGKAIRIREADLEDFLDNFVGDEENSIKTVTRGPVLYTAEQVSKILKLSIDNIWNLLKTGKLKGFKIREGRSSWRIPSDSLDEFIESRTRKTI